MNMLFEHIFLEKVFLRTCWVNTFFKDIVIKKMFMHFLDTLGKKVFKDNMKIFSRDILDMKIFIF